MMTVEELWQALGEARRTRPDAKVMMNHHGDFYEPIWTGLGEEEQTAPNIRSPVFWIDVE